MEAIVAFLSTVFTSSGRELEVGVGREMEQLGFSSSRFLTVSMFSSIILVTEGPGSLQEGTSSNAINLSIKSLGRRNCEEADVVTM